MLVKFTKSLNVYGAEKEIVDTFLKNEVYKLSESSAERWLRRGLAVLVSAEDVKAKEAEVEDKPKAQKTKGKA